MTRGLDESSSRTQTCQKWCPKCQFYGKFRKSQDWSRMIIYDSRELQEDVLRDRGFQKTHQLEKFETFQNHPKPTTSDLENGSKSQISLCWRTIFLQMSSGASLSIILLIWCEALSFIFVPGRQYMQSGPLTRNLVTFNFELLVLSI